MGISLDFYKYQGTGNDFIMIDEIKGASMNFKLELVKFLCDRRFGIGADGLIVLRPSVQEDFYMEYYNSDGNKGTMCGNGGRCIVKFAYDLGYISSLTSFEAMDGIHKAEIINNLVSLHMIDVNKVIVEPNGAYVLNTGSPHFVQFVKEEGKLNEIVEFGKQVRYSDSYIQEGINVNLVYPTSINSIMISTYERGVEDETYSCGTGVTAACIALAHRLNSNGEIIVSAKGGLLSVSFDRFGDGFKNIILTGPAEMVFKGTINI